LEGAGKLTGKSKRLKFNPSGKYLVDDEDINRFSKVQYELYCIKNFKAMSKRPKGN